MQCLYPNITIEWETGEYDILYAWVLFFLIITIRFHCALFDEGTQRRTKTIKFSSLVVLFNNGDNRRRGKRGSRHWVFGDRSFQREGFKIQTSLFQNHLDKWLFLPKGKMGRQQRGWTKLVQNQIDDEQLPKTWCNKYCPDTERTKTWSQLSDKQKQQAKDKYKDTRQYS